MYNPEKVTHAIIEFVDIAGLVKGASKGEGLGNKFLSHIREVDSIAQVVRCFEDPNVVHVDGSIDPIRDIDTINLELILADLETIDKRLERAKKNLKADKKYQAEIDLIEKLKEEMEKSYFLPPTNSYISALMPPILPIMHQMMPQFCPPSVCNPYSLHKFH